MMLQAHMALDMDEAGLRKRVLDMHAGDARAVERVLAAYKKQFSAATPWDRYVQITTDAGMGIDSIHTAERKAAQGGAPVYLYRFDYETPKLGGHLRAMHGMEIPFVFNNVKNTSWMVEDSLATERLGT